MQPHHLLILAALSTSPELADKPPADDCAAALPSNARMFYDAAEANVRSGGSLESELRSVAIPLVITGRLSRSEARDAAEAAARCLEMLTAH